MVPLTIIVHGPIGNALREDCGPSGIPRGWNPSLTTKKARSGLQDIRQGFSPTDDAVEEDSTNERDT